MKTNQIKDTIKILGEKGVVFDVGLTDNEVVAVETKFNFKFPPDLKSFLQTALPVSKKFVNWRLALTSEQESDVVFDKLNWPLEGMIFDIEKNNFWFADWGKMPDSIDEKILIAKKHYQEYPKLIPIFAHRYIPSLPNEIDNPIFSVYQTDIIYYGLNLETYFANEFGYTKSGNYELYEYPEKKIEFWSKITEENI